MKRFNKYLRYTISFLIGVFTCYITLQFCFFDLDLKLSVPETLLDITTIFVGIYIAHTIQKNINKEQNQYTYIELKLDTLWTKFNKFSQVLTYNDKIEAQEISQFNEEIIFPIKLLKDISTAFKIETNSLDLLENQLTEFETFIISLEPIENIIELTSHKKDIDLKIININKQFAVILTLIQDM